MKTSEVLNAAADLIESTGWTRLFYARDAEGYSVPPESPRATCFCASGAIRRIAGQTVWTRTLTVLAESLSCSGLGKQGDSVALWNDDPERTAEEVVSAMRAAAQSVANGETV